MVEDRKENRKSFLGKMSQKLDDREVVAATQVIVDTPLKIQDEGRITDRQIEDRRKWSMTVEIPKQKKGAGELFYKGVEISRGDTFGRRQVNAAHRDRLM
nr:hypothetical protein BaRGS_035234 [Batillaria attramentaria]KAG5705516.1 hypothetical protein BaRGS_009169 [Batillaria attramentaria]KAG5708232.1 hypothetical protein BaRGS_021166 [Batillaria attramentaria]